ncbi:MAG: histidine phosphatase family protein, partial [Alphaproteobacteria bacterium]
YGSVLIVGHNPGLEELARALLGDADTPEANALRSKYPTGAYAEFTLQGPWRRGAAGPARLCRFITPRALPARNST